jgi:regulator of protease activity HflC (stomatin/prohibitin superfamily)
VTADTPKGTPEGPIAQSIAIGFKAVSAAVLVLGAVWAVSNWRQVPPESQAVVLQFGRIARVQQAGLTVAWPRPMGDIVVLPGHDRLLTLRTAAPTYLGGLQNVYTDANGVTVPSDAGSYLTGDGGVVLLAATLSYQVSDGAAYFLARDHVEPALRRMFEMAAVHVAATRPLDDFLVTRAGAANLQDRRQAVRGDFVDAMNDRLADLAGQGAPLGVTVSRVDLEPSLPPDAKIAFDGVLVADQLAEQAIATARTQAARTLQAADRERDLVLTEARANSAERVSAARVQTASISAIQATLTPDARPTMLDQLYRERIGTIMHRIGKVVLVDRQGGRVIVPAEAPAP